MSRVYYNTIDYLGGGVNDYNRPDMIGSGETPNTARNIRGEAESFRPRKGYTTFAEEVSSVTVRGVSPYLRNTDTEDTLVFMGSDNKLYKINPATQTTYTEVDTSSLITDTTNINFANYGDWLFIFNGVDKPVRVDNTSTAADFTHPTALSAATFLPEFGEIYNDQLFVAGVPTAPNYVFVSKIASATNQEYIYDFGGTTGAYGDTADIPFPDRVTAIRKLSDAIVVFTVTGAWYIKGLVDFGSTTVYNRQPIGGAGGAISQKSTVVVENDIYYLTPQKEIKSVRRGFSDQLSIVTESLSTKIQKFLNDEIDTDLSTAFALYDQPNKTYELFLRVKQGTHNSVRIVGDIDQVDPNSGIPPFYIDNGMVFSAGAYYTTNGTQKSYLGSPVIGQLYANNDGLADDDAAIETFRATKEFTAGDQTQVKNFRSVFLYGEMSNTTNIDVRVYVDNLIVCEATITPDDFPTGSTTLDSGIGTESIGSFTIGDEGGATASEFDDLRDFTKRLTFRQKGKRLRVEFSTDGINNNYRIRRLEYGYISLPRTFYSVIEK